VNVKLIIPLFKINKEDQELTLNLIYNKKNNALFDFIEHFEEMSGEVKEEIDEDKLTLDEKIKKRIIDGSKTGLQELLNEKLKKSLHWTLLIISLSVPMKLSGAFRKRRASTSFCSAVCRSNESGSRHIEAFH